MLDLVLCAGEGPVSLPEIAQRQGISLSYLEQLFARLRRARLVKSSRGPRGGYELALPATAVSVAMIARAMDEKIEMSGCHDGGECPKDGSCLPHHLWMDLSTYIHDFLDGISLADLVDRLQCREHAAPQDHELPRLMSTITVG